jgi:hypothetical protein
MKAKLIVACLLAFCGFANAGTLAESFVFNNGNTLDITHIRKIGCSANLTSVTYFTGGLSYTDLPDTSCTVFNKIKTSANFSKSFVPWGSDYLNVDVTDSVRCNASTQTLIIWTYGGSEQFSDGCALVTTVRNASN